MHSECYDQTDTESDSSQYNWILLFSLRCIPLIQFLTAHLTVGYAYPVTRAMSDSETTEGREIFQVDEDHDEYGVIEYK